MLGYGRPCKMWSESVQKEEKSDSFITSGFQRPYANFCTMTIFGTWTEYELMIALALIYTFFLLVTTLEVLVAHDRPQALFSDLVPARPVQDYIPGRPNLRAVRRAAPDRRRYISALWKRRYCPSWLDCGASAGYT